MLVNRSVVVESGDYYDFKSLLWERRETFSQWVRLRMAEELAALEQAHIPRSEKKGAE